VNTVYDVKWTFWSGLA